MAKQSAGYLGGFSGRLGPAVGYMWNGKWCLRSHQPLVRNPRTEAQVAHRELFKQQVQLAARMRQAVVRSFTELAREAGMTSYNLFVSVNQPAFGGAEGVLQVDYSRLRLSIGDVMPVELSELQRTEDNVLRVRYRSAGGSRYDYVYLYVYSPDVEQGYLSAPAYRMDKRLALQLPDALAGHELQVYLLVQSQDGRWSDSVYCGSVMEGERLDAETGEVEYTRTQTTVIQDKTTDRATETPAAKVKKRRGTADEHAVQ
ncbi:MAG: DUF6266 family protein [Bacteroidales bacterium]|nr:DUF6266 family protein [Bacteroidales bacterium]